MNRHDNELLQAVLQDEYYDAAYHESRSNCLFYIQKRRQYKRLLYRRLAWSIAASFLLVAIFLFHNGPQETASLKILVKSQALKQEQIRTTAQARAEAVEGVVEVVATKAKIEIARPAAKPKLSLVSHGELFQLFSDRPLLLLQDNNHHAKFILLNSAGDLPRD
jgi:hypothetical protein